MREKLRTVTTRSVSWWRRQSRTRKILLIIGAVIVLYIIFHHRDPLSGKTIETAKIQDLTQTVRASGTVTSATNLDLSFQASDLVSAVNIAVGDRVQKGRVLAELSHAAESAQLLQAQGRLLAARAAYDKVTEGSSSEEVHVAQVALDTTQKQQDTLVENARRKLFTDDLVAEPQDPINTTNSPILSGTYNGTDEGQYRLYFKSNTTYDIQYRGLESGTAEVSVSAKPLGTQGLYLTFPAPSYSPSDSWLISIPNKKGANYTANLNAYNAALQTRDTEVAQAEANLNLKKATGRSADVNAAYANVLTAQGEYNEALATLNKKIIRAPADGTITKVDIKVGELAQSLTPVVTLQDVSHLYLEAPVNESDISNLLVDQPVSVTYDAFGPDKTFTGHISSINIAPTITDGIVNYTIKALLDDTTLIRPGMTANLTIVTASVPQVLVIPGRTITAKNGTKTVSVLIDARKGKTRAQEITTGLYGDGNLVQVTSGLAAGDQLLFDPKQ